MELELNFSFLSLQVPAVIELYKFGILFSIETMYLEKLLQSFKVGVNLAIP